MDRQTDRYRQGKRGKSNRREGEEEVEKGEADLAAELVLRLR